MRASPTPQNDEAAELLLQAARRIDAAADPPASGEAIEVTLGCFEEALTILSSTCYRLATASAPVNAHRTSTAPPRVMGGSLSREEQARLATRLHDTAAGLTRATQLSREARAAVARARIEDRRLDATADRR
jgi:hypothetical protein